MATYLIAYDLRNETGSQDYQPLWDNLKENGCLRTQQSLWLGGFSNSAEDLHTHFKKFLDGDDRLWVAELTTNSWYSGAMAGTTNFLSENPRASCKA